MAIALSKNNTNTIEPSVDMVEESNVPLCVDLDGTLIHSDLLLESLLKLIKSNPLYIFWVFAWLVKGKANLKRQIADRVELAVDVLPYNQELLAYLRDQQGKRELVLATASDFRYAQEVSNHLGLFDTVYATRDGVNLKSKNKANTLVEAYGLGGFDYIGNDEKDWSVWADSREKYVVSASRRFIEEVQQKYAQAKIFEVERPGPATWIKALRVHQWSKNLLLFLPFFLDHRFSDLGSFILLCGCFFCFSFLASATYILNDLLDLESDRRNTSKMSRPFAAGKISIPHALAMMGILLVLVLTLLVILPKSFAATVFLYFAVTLSYSFIIKTIPILDVCCLAALYTIRVIGGGLAIGADVSFWLLAFSMFFFLSLALAKRVSELKNVEKKAGQSAMGRGYTTDDMSLLLMMGVSTGYLSVLVVAFYINSEKVISMYEHQEILWLVCPILLYWIGRVWLYTERGRMNEDPIIFAFKDRGSLLAMFLAGVFVLAAMFYT